MSETTQAKVCPKCGGVIPIEAPQGLCPKCLLRQASVATELGKAGPTKATPPSCEEIAAAFPQLEILELIGQGGMGFVFKARQPKLDRLVALKILPQALASEPAFAERFAREGRMLARLNHPNIVTIHDFGQVNGLFYLLMEFVDGVNLRQAMRIGRFTATQALAVVPRICEALQFAHNEGILHRDIKPENILLDSKGRVKIADFGIAKLVGMGSPSLASTGEAASEPHGSPVTLTETGKTLGTPHYMAPEQLEHPEDVDQRADIYSLGVVFYEMLTGELPIGRFAPPSQKSEADARVDEVVLRALHKERELRQKSAEEVKTQVETITAGGSGRAASSKDPAVPPVRQAMGRHLTRAMVAGLVVLFLVTFAATLITFIIPESYRATARLKLEPAQPQAAGSFDPYLLQGEVETVRSMAVLEPVIQHLKLQARWSQRYGIPNLSPTEAVQLLERQLEVQPLRNTMLLELSVFSEQPHEAAEIANGIARDYSAYCSGRIQAMQASGDPTALARSVRVEVLDAATPPVRPSRPNKPLNIALGILLGVILGTLAGFLVGLLSAWRSRATGPPPPKPEVFWRWLALGGVMVIALPLGVALVAILAATAYPAFSRHGNAQLSPAVPTAQRSDITDGYLSISKLDFTAYNPEPGQSNWGFKAFVPPGHLASIVFVCWTNGVPTIYPEFSAYYKVGLTTGIDIEACTLSCYPIAQSTLAMMTNAGARRDLARWGIPESSSSTLTNVVQWNVNLGLGFTSSRWLQTPPYHASEATLPQSLPTGRQGYFGLVHFDRPPGQSNRGRSGIELRFFLRPFEGTPIRMLPNEIYRTNYVAGTGLADTLEETLRAIQTLPLDQ